MKKLAIIGVSSLLVRKITYFGSVHNWIRDKYYEKLRVRYESL